MSLPFFSSKYTAIKPNFNNILLGKQTSKAYCNKQKPTSAISCDIIAFSPLYSVIHSLDFQIVKETGDVMFRYVSISNCTHLNN